MTDSNSNSIGMIFTLGTEIEIVEIVMPTEQQIETLRRYIGKEISIRRVYHFSFMDDDGDVLGGTKIENHTIRLEEVTESAIKGKSQDKDITMEFIAAHSEITQTNYIGLNHPQGFRDTFGKRYIDEIRCGSEILYKATLK